MARMSVIDEKKKQERKLSATGLHFDRVAAGEYFMYTQRTQCALCSGQNCSGIKKRTEIGSEGNRINQL